MKHWAVRVDTKTYVVEAETAEQADRAAVIKWFEENYISIKHAKQVFCPCQWGGKCPTDVTSCSGCFKKMKGE